MRIYKKNKIKTNIIILKFNFDIEDLEFKEEILAHSVLQVTLELKGVYDIGYKRFDFAIWIDRYLISIRCFSIFLYTRKSSRQSNSLFWSDFDSNIS